MKKIILISLFGLMFSQAEFTTRAISIPISYFRDLCVNEYSGYGNWGCEGVINENFLGQDIDTGYIGFARFKNCNVSMDESSNFAFQVWGAGGGVYIHRNAAESMFNYPYPIQEIMEGSFNIDSWLGYTSSIAMNTTNIPNIDNYMSCEVEFFVTADFGDEAGLIDDLQDQINDLEVQVEGLLAELLDCEGCNGDINADENIDILDILAVVEHILDIDTNNCIE